MPRRIGTIREMNRYPVKSFAGERLDACLIEPYGLYGDRFRPNLVVALEDDAAGEEEWIDRRLMIGAEAELHPYRICKRCSMITTDPDTLDQDPTLLRTVAQRLRSNFGVYASVKKTGSIRVGDPVLLQ